MFLDLKDPWPPPPPNEPPAKAAPTLSPRRQGVLAVFVVLNLLLMLLGPLAGSSVISGVVRLFQP